MLFMSYICINVGRTKAIFYLHFHKNRRLAFLESARLLKSQLLVRVDSRSISVARISMIKDRDLDPIFIHVDLTSKFQAYFEI